AFARRAVDAILGVAPPSLAALATVKPPPGAREGWPALCALIQTLAAPGAAWAGQLGAIRQFYEPLLIERYDAAEARLGDLAQLEALAGTYADRASFLEDLTLDPPSATGDLAGPPHLDE